MAKTPTYTEVYVLKITKEQKQTLYKIKERGFVVSKFVQDLKPKTKKEKVPF